MSEYSVSNLQVLYEDNHLLVLDKPPQLATMGVGETEPSLLKISKEYIRQKYNKPGNVYLGVVSRLDSFTTGAIVFARTSKSASRLSAQIREGKIQKTYWALLPSGLEQDEGELEHYVYKDDDRRRMFATEQSLPSAKLARLKYRVLGAVEDTCLIEVDLETGRKHQIRVQFSHLGYPIIGDRKYGSKLPFKKGIALHCRSLQFEHPTQKTLVNIESSPPSWWKLSRFGIS